MAQIETTTRPPVTDRTGREQLAKILTKEGLSDGEPEEELARSITLDKLLDLCDRRLTSRAHEEAKATARREAEAAHAGQPNIVEVEQTAQPRQGKVETAELLPVPVPIPLRKFTPPPEPTPAARACGRSVVDSPGSPFGPTLGASHINGVGTRTADGGIIKDVSYVEI